MIKKSLYWLIKDPSTLWAQISLLDKIDATKQIQET